MGDEALTCILWGELAGLGLLIHPTCPVIESGDPPRPPRVCSCECQTCKRAWWAQGRPIVRDGQIVRR
jgi:hypothetical protein